MSSQMTSTPMPGRKGRVVAGDSTQNLGPPAALSRSGVPVPPTGDVVLTRETANQGSNSHYGVGPVVIPHGPATVDRRST
jgi:hypothetical protein